MNLDRLDAPRRVSLTGPFCILTGRTDFARIAARGSDCEFWLRGAGVDATALESLPDLDLVWGDDVSGATLCNAAARMEWHLAAAAVHTPLPDLYACLPLQSYDAVARNFWHKVFSLVRLPGGRYLLGFLARRARRPASADRAP